jgi:hypothetical protein
MVAIKIAQAVAAGPLAHMLVHFFCALDGSLYFLEGSFMKYARVYTARSHSTSISP